MSGGPTDDDGWADAADEEPGPPTEASGEIETETPAPPAEPEPEPEPAPEPDPEPAPEPEPEPEPEPDAEPDPEEPGWSGTLAEAAGIDVPPDKPERKPVLSRRGWFFAILTLFLLTVLAAGGVLSYINSQRLYLACGADDVRAERGSWFLWGRSRLEGDRWKPFKLPGVCESRELDSETELEAAFLELLLHRASALLAAEKPDLDEGEALIEQGMALARAPEHKPVRKQLERLGGDVEYWRGRAAVDGAIERLKSARQHVDEAVKIGPRHAGDADRWVPFIDRALERLGAGPGAFEDTDRDSPPAPTTPKTVEPDAAPPAKPVVIPDAGAPATPEPDAGVPRGGVLL